MSNATTSRVVDETVTARPARMGDGWQALLQLGLTLVLCCLTVLVTRRTAATFDHTMGAHCSVPPARDAAVRGPLSLVQGVAAGFQRARRGRRSR